MPTSLQAASEFASPAPFSSAAPALARPRLGTAAALLLVLLCCLLPVSRVFGSSGGRINLCPADALLPALLLVYRRTWLHSGWLGWWLLALWVTSLISWSLSVSLLEPFTLAREIMKVLTCYAYALIGYAIARDYRSESLLVRGLSLTAVLIALGSVSAYFTGVPQFFIGNGRVVGSFNDPNAYGVYLAMLFPVMAALPVGWAAVPIIAGGTIASLSRTGLVTMGFSMLLSLGHLPLRRYLPLVIACVVALTVTYGRARRTNELSGRIVAYQDSLSERESLWALGFEVASAHPLFGIGKGNWQAVTKQKTISHNTFLQIAADSGFVGLLVMVVPLFCQLAFGLRRPDTRPWAVALAVALVGGLAVSFDNFRPFWLVVGLLAGRLSLPAEAPAPRAGLRTAR